MNFSGLYGEKICGKKVNVQGTISTDISVDKEEKTIAFTGRSVSYKFYHSLSFFK